jgi:hypothetical protein
MSTHNNNVTKSISVAIKIVVVQLLGALPLNKVFPHIIFFLFLLLKVKKKFSLVKLSS